MSERIDLTSLVQMSEGKLVVSACLAGLPCRYDGQSKPHSAVRALVEKGLAVTVCPEQLGGLSTPRPPAGIKMTAMSECSDATSNGCQTEMSDGVHECSIGGVAVWQDRAILVNREGRDVTAEYKRGAEAALAIAEKLGARYAILKQHSPSCGCGSTGGAEPWQRIGGDGVTAALFKRSGITVISDEQLS